MYFTVQRGILQALPGFCKDGGVVQVMEKFDIYFAKGIGTMTVLHGA